MTLDRELDGKIVEAIKQNAVRVPPFPAAVLKLSAVIQRPTHSLDEVVNVVQQDPALAASVLRVANSVYFRRDEAVTGLKKAITRIGEKELSHVVMAAGLSRTALAPGPLSALRRQVWHEALVGATLSEVVARAVGRNPEEHFVLGLLHDVGRLVAVVTLEKLLEGSKTEPRSADEWWPVVEQYHVELGLVLATKWGLPAMVSDVISQHHAPKPVGQYAPSAEVVAASDQLVILLQGRDTIDPEVLTAVRLLERAEQREQVAREIPLALGVVANMEQDIVPDTSRSLVIPASGGTPVPETLSPAPVTRTASPSPSPSPAPSAPAPGSPAQAMLKPFSVGLPAKGVTCEGTGVSTSAVRFLSPVAMQLNFLVEVELTAHGGPFRMLAKVQRCDARSEGHDVEVSPFALSGAAAQHWREFQHAG
ncbi:MAG: HDOD domain-containing protein [Myxococcaceae bacterium]|nr:HDOD domain-containing protein [Myxococcaceae bacterium]